MARKFISLEVVERKPGYIAITSAEMPELNLWGPPEEVFNAILPAVKSLLKHNEGIDAEVEFAPPRFKAQEALEDVPSGCMLSLAA